MSQEIRRRSPTTITMQNDSSSAEGSNGPVNYAAGLRVPNMLKASPQHTGDVCKLHIPVMFSVLPRFLRRFLVQWKTLSSFLGLLPEWKPRFLILLGRFLYKFTSQHDNKAPPKGRPLALESLDIFHLEQADISMDKNAEALWERPIGFQHVFVVSTLRKTHYYACGTREEASTWVNALKQAQQEAIKRDMGHAPTESYPASWSYFDNMGRNLVKSKDRIEQRLEEANQQELEMTNMGAGGPQGGYYG